MASEPRSSDALTPEALEFNSSGAGTSYVGTREQLIEAGVAVPQMFPIPPKRRRLSRHDAKLHDLVVGHFAVTLMKDGRWRVTRDLLWQDPDALQRLDAEHEAWVEQYHARKAQESKRAEGPQTADEFKRRVHGFAAAIRLVIDEATSGKSRMNGYRFAADDASEIREGLDDLLALIDNAAVVREGVIDGLEAPLAECLRSILARPRASP